MLLPAIIQLPYIPGASELRPFIAEIWLTLTIIAVLVTPFFSRRSNLACGLVTLAGLAAALVSLLAVVSSGSADGEHFRGMLVSDHVALYWKIILLLFTFGIVLLWFGSSAAEMHEGDGPEFFTLLLGATLGMSLMSSTANLLMVVISIELASLPSYVLAGFRKTDRIGAEASLKYVLFGAATSSIMIYGLSLLYGLYGTLSVAELANQIAAGHAGSGALLCVAVFGLIVGIGFKIAAVPFHFWCPDVFQGAGIDVAAFLSVASKGAGLVLLLRLLSLVAQGMGYADVQPLAAIAVVIGIVGAVTATVGNTAAFVQDNIKRLLAYSSIAHAGYMLCALSLLYSHRAPGAGPVNGPVAALADSSAQALLLYLTIYLFMNLGAFTVAAIVARQGGGETLAAYAGLGRRAPVLAVCMAVFMFSLVGLPPFAGFLAKLNVMYILARNGGWWWWLVAAIGLNTILSLYYYLRVVKMMYLTPPDAPPFTPKILGTSISVLCAAMLILMLLGFSPVLRITSEYSKLFSSEKKELTTENTKATEKYQFVFSPR